MSSFGSEPPFQNQSGSGQQPGSPPPPPPPPGYAPSQPPAPGQPQPYNYSPTPQAANPFDSKATTILVLGILGLVVCQILAVVAWVMGNNLKKEAAAAGYPEPGQAKAGRICGMIGTILMVIGVVFFVLIFVLAAASSTT